LSGYVIGKSAEFSAEHRIARFETGDMAADGFDGAREVDTQARVFRGTESGAEAHQVRGSLQVVPVERIDGGRAHPDQHFPVLR
jgi:hypothetical protein